MKTYNQTTAPTFADVLTVARDYANSKADSLHKLAKRAAAQIWARYSEEITAAVVVVFAAVVLLVASDVQAARM